MAISCGCAVDVTHNFTDESGQRFPSRAIIVPCAAHLPRLCARRFARAERSARRRRS